MPWSRRSGHRQWTRPRIFTGSGAYDCPVTLAAVVLAAIGALTVGLILGFLIGRRVQTAARQGSPDGGSAADLVQRAVLSSHNGVVLLNSFGEVVLANAAAVALGLVRGSRPDERAGKAAEQVRATGEVVQVDLSPLDRGTRAGRGPTAVLGEVRPLGEDSRSSTHPTNLTRSGWKRPGGISWPMSATS